MKSTKVNRQTSKAGFEPATFRTGIWYSIRWATCSQIHRNHMNLSFKKLDRELYYHPHWQLDKKLFLRLLKQSHFTDKDTLLVARLYVKYSHLHCSRISELTIYFSYMLQKMQIDSAESLFERTNNIYSKLGN